MNKNTKIWANYLLGAAVSLFLLYTIYTDVAKQTTNFNPDIWTHTGPKIYLWLCICLLFVNTSLEGRKWYLLARMADHVTYARAFASYLAGIAIAIVTPNRIGEYPGRILYLGAKSTHRYVNVSVLGILSQLLGIYLLGFCGLICYCAYHPSAAVEIALLACGVATLIMSLVYWRFENWLPYLNKLAFLKKLATYGRLLVPASKGRQMTVLLLSLMRAFIFTAQYLFLLKWMNVELPLIQGFFLCALFFWLMAIIPAIAFTGLVARMKVGLLLFSQYPGSAHGILAATAGIWLLNVVVPSIIGSILILRMRLLR